MSPELLDDEQQPVVVFFVLQAEDGIRDWSVTGVQTCALPIYLSTPPARPAIDKLAVTDTPTACALDSAPCTLIAPALTRTSRPAPPSIPIAVTSAVLRPSARATPAATPPVIAPFKVADTVTAPASALTFCSVIWPSFFSRSSPAAPARPFAVDVAVPLVSARAAPAESPTLDPDRATEMLAACAEAPTSSTLILPLLLLARVSSPVPPSAPVATANALPLASARPAAMVRPFWAAAASTETVTAPASALTRCSVTPPSL